MSPVYFAVIAAPVEPERYRLEAKTFDRALEEAKELAAAWGEELDWIETAEGIEYLEPELIDVEPGKPLPKPKPVKWWKPSR